MDKSNIHTEVEEVIPKAVSSALIEYLINLVQVVAIKQNLSRNKNVWRGTAPPHWEEEGRGEVGWRLVRRDNTDNTKDKDIVGHRI